MSDRGYINLLSHLNRTSTNLPLSTIQASIAHYLSTMQPSPTPLAATVISSPLFRRSSGYGSGSGYGNGSVSGIGIGIGIGVGPGSAGAHAKLESLSTAFRHALHLKVKALKTEAEQSGFVFGRGWKGRLGEWVQGVMKGLQGGEEMLRLSCYTGLLLGLGDWEVDLGAKESRMRRKVEEELVISLAEVMELYPHKTSLGWEHEFKVGSGPQDAANALSSAFLLASRSLPLVATPRLKALPLRGLISGLLSTIDTAFHSGTFLSTLGSSPSSSHSGKFSIDELHQINASPIILSMAPLARMCGRSLSALADSRPIQGWLAMSETMQRLSALTRTIETDWLNGPLVGIYDEDAIEPETKKLLVEMWNVLKTALFTIIMIVQSVLTNLVYVAQPEGISSSRESQSSPFAFTLTAMHIFSNLAFVLPQFGGVISTAEGSLPELKKVFYTALDVLAADEAESRRFVRELSEENLEGRNLPLPFFHAKKSYALACLEQLIPVLDDDSLRNNIYPMCAPHLSDSSHRETYESSHSVMLAIFASHSQKMGERGVGERGDGDEEEGMKRQQPFAEQIVPFYAQCLIDNSSDGKLNLVQLSLAYAALVRSAGSFGHGHGRTIEQSPSLSLSLSESSETTTTITGDAFAWFCIEALLRAIQSPQQPQLLAPSQPSTSSQPSISSSSAPSASSVPSSTPSLSQAHLHRLHLTLIATVPSVSLALLPKLLAEVLEIIVHAEGSRRDELVKALFKEISENVGDLEKEFAMGWWYEHRDQMGGDKVSASRREEILEIVGKGKGKEREVVSRL